MANVAFAAARIYVRYCTDAEYAREAEASNEPYRCLHTNSPFAEEIPDGSEEYIKLIEILEVLMTEGKYL